MAQADAAALVTAEVHDHALALGRDALEREVELRAAVAAHRTEHVTGEAFGVDAHEHVLVARHLAAHERDVLGAVEQRLEHVRREVTVLGRDARFGDPPHQLLAVPAEPDQVRDGDEREPVFRRERLEVGHALHRAVVVHDLREHTGRVGPGHAREVDRGLRVTGALQHAALAVPQREDVSRTREILGLRRRIDHRVHRRHCDRPRRCRSSCRPSRRRKR